MIPRTISEDNLREMFSPHGEVKVVNLLKNYDGSRKPCAFVRMSNREECDRAIAELSGSCLLYTSPSPRDRQKSRMPSSA